MDLQRLIDNAQQMPNIPKVVQELIQSFANDDTDADEIVKSIAKDQVLTAKVLRMANSSRYAGTRQVGSLNDAVVLLGFNALRTLTLASGLSGAFKFPEGFDIKQFWKNSFTIAELSKWLAGFTTIDKDVAYTCGMIHNIGELLIHTLVPEQASKVDSLRSLAQENERAQIEYNELGFDFTEAGSELARRWQFPEPLVMAIAQQLEPADGENFYPFAGLLYLANYINTLNGSDNPEPMKLNFPTAIARELAIDPDQVIACLDETRDFDAALDGLVD